MTQFIEDDEQDSFQEENILLEEDFMPKLSLEYRTQLEKQWVQWSKENSKRAHTITAEHVKETLMKDLEFLCTMSSEEYTLYRKFVEIHREYPYDFKQAEQINTFWSTDGPRYPELEPFKNNIWIPDSLQDYKELKPEIICTNTRPGLVEDWNVLRTFLSTMINNANIGRNLYFIIKNKNKYLGVMALSSDFLDLTPRDEYIGWSRESKTHGRMINHTAIGSTIVPTQPLGYNFVGGKLIALLILSKVVEEAWNSVYDRTQMPSKLAGITTTSLYSSFSQYTNLKYWNSLGHSAGSIKFEPSQETIDIVKQWLMGYDDNDGKGPGRRFWEWYIATEPGGMPLKRDYKQRSLSFVYSKLKIDKKYFQTNHTRGIYFCPLFNTTKEYLRGEIPTLEEKDRRFDNSVEALTELWKEKYAVKRIDKLVADNRVSNEILFYDDVIKMTWPEVRAKYLKDVGR